VPAHWDKLAAAEPAGGVLVASEVVQRTTGTVRPVVRGDWLASAASRPPMYYELLGLPKTNADTARLVGVERETDAHHGHVARSGLRASTVTHGPRAVERHAARGGGSTWLALDFGNAVPADEVAAGLAGAAGNRPAPKPDTTRMLLGLPNGLSAFALFDRDGRRLDRVAETGSRDGQPEAITEAGRGCMACHATGPLAFTDDLRGPAAGGETHAAATTPAPEEENYRYRRALVQAGVDPDRTLDGLDIITALARRYEESAPLERVAAEAGLDRDTLARRLGAMTGDGATAARRLLQGVLPRAQVEPLLAALRAAAEQPVPPTTADAAPPATGPQPATVETAAAGGGLDLILASNRPAYTSGDVVSFQVVASADCYLTLISVDSSQKATVLFPNDYEPNNLITAGRTIKVPSDKAPYQLRSKDKGRETTVAICQTQTRVPPGITPDYERQHFTILGNWPNFLNAEQAADRSAAGEWTRARPVRGKAPAKPEPRAPVADLTTRTAISYTVD